MAQVQGSIDSWVEQEIDAFFTTPTVGQSKRYRAYCKITVGGVDVTDRLAPYLISVTVHTGMKEWSADIELDDRDGRLAIPPIQSPVIVWLGWTTENAYEVFTGFTSSVEHGFGRRMGGRRMWVHASGALMDGGGKTTVQDHLGEGAQPGKMEGTSNMFEDAFNQFAATSGLTPVVGDSFKSMARDYFSINNESIWQWATRMAHENGAFTWVAGNQIFFYGLDDFKAAPLTCKWGDNLISWRIHPYVARSMWSGASQEFFDHVKGLWGKLSSQFNLMNPWGSASAISKLPLPAPNSTTAQQNTQGAQNMADAYSGQGRVIINGEPQAQQGAVATIVGARPGVDGDYMVLGVTHTYSRQGFVTTLEIAPNASSSSGNSVGAQGYGTGANPNAAQEIALLAAQQTGQPQQINNPDGSVMIIFPNGMITVTNALGTTTVQPPQT